MQCYIEKREFKTAVQWLQQAAKVPVHGKDVSLTLCEILYGHYDTPCHIPVPKTVQKCATANDCYI